MWSEARTDRGGSGIVMGVMRGYIVMTALLFIDYDDDRR